MTKEEKIAYWLDLADYDIETAEGLFVVKRWLYVGFMCHQVIEKALNPIGASQEMTIRPTFIIWRNCQSVTDYTNRCRLSNNGR